MRRLLIVFALLVSALVAAAAKADLLQYQLSQPLLDFIAATPEGRDLAVGEGKFSTTEKGVSDQVTFSGHGTPTDAVGSVVYHMTGFSEEHGTVHCVYVIGNRAALSGTFDQPVGGVFPFFTVVVEDNGEPSATNPTPDQALAYTLTQSFDEFPDCGFSALAVGQLPIVQGNVVVIDRT
jgi:hypothetical protein